MLENLVLFIVLIILFYSKLPGLSKVNHYF